MRGLAQIARLTVLAASLWGGAAAAEQARYSPQQMRAIGYQLMTSGDALGARAVAEALLSRDPADPVALLLQAQAQAVLLGGAAARRPAKLAYRRADNAETRFSAAMFVANSFVADGQKTAAQLWLRRAAQVAPDADSRALAADSHAKVRSRNPLVMAFDLSLRPSSNVNNGSSAASYKNPGIPWLPADIPLAGEDLALSGTVATVAADLTYRLPPTQTTRTELTLHLDQSKVWLSDQALAIAPSALASNYEMATAEAGLTRFYRPLDSKITYRFAAVLGQDWSAGKALSDRLRLEASAQWALRPDLQATASVTGEATSRRDVALRSSDVRALSLGMIKRQENGDSWQLTLSQRQTDSDSPGIRSTATSARLGWTKAEPVGGIGLSASAVAELRRYPDSPYSPTTGRQDEKLGLTVTLDLRQIDYMGFSPSLNLTASQTKSNVALFSAHEIGLNIGFKSNF